MIHEINACKIFINLSHAFYSTTIKMASNVDYTVFFSSPSPPPLNNKDCVARCKTCSKPYKYTLTTKGNLLKHLQTSHGQPLEQHKARTATAEE